jgi:tripartite-type tricarboxylate transporter receptor subunit TctC
LRAIADFGASKATPAEIIDKLNKEINAGLADPKIKTRLAVLGGTVLAGSPTDFGKLIADESQGDQVCGYQARLRRQSIHVP